MLFEISLSIYLNVTLNNMACLAVLRLTSVYINSDSFENKAAKVLQLVCSHRKTNLLFSAYLLDMFACWFEKITTSQLLTVQLAKITRQKTLTKDIAPSERYVFISYDTVTCRRYKHIQWYLSLFPPKRRAEPKFIFSFKGPHPLFCKVSIFYTKLDYKMCILL